MCRNRTRASRRVRLLPIVVSALVAIAAASVSPATARRRAKQVSAPPARHLAPVLQRMLAHELAPARPLEKGGEQEQEAVSPPNAFRTLPEAPSLVQQTAPGLATDALVNNKTVNTCSGCQNLPIAQDEASVAVLGPDVVVSFNDMRSRCGLVTRQNFGYSSDGGATFTDGNGVYKDAGGGNMWGDPSVAVNAKTGEFYVAGLYQGPSGVGGARGHFNGATWVWDGGRVTAASASGDFYDKPWMTVDSTSGNVYFTWTNFDGAGNVYIALQRCDANLAPIGPMQVLSDTTLANSAGVQFSQLAVGPGGMLYVIWQQYWPALGMTLDGPLQVAVRRSSDFGVTWSPVVYIAPPHPVNDSNGGPGFLRGFASLQPTIAVDNSSGPHRGRIYVAWDEALDYQSVPLAETTALVDPGGNSTPATAVPFVPGGKLRGTMNNVEEDWFSFALNAGDTFYLSDVMNYSASYDSTREGVMAQLYSPDLSGTLHLAANASGTSGSLLYTAPRTATYYLRLSEIYAVVSPYVFYTVVIPAGQYADVALDSRDQVVAWSDDGTAWSAPVRVNDSAPGADAQYPSLTVDGRGRVYCGFMDWRDDHESGTASTQYVVMSGDGGVTWGPNVRAGDAVAGWSANVCQSNGNTQGDYQMMAADGDRVALAFTDARLGDPDIFVDASVFTQSASAPAVFVASAGQDATLAMTVHNDGNFARQLSWQLTNPAGWLTGATAGAPTIAPHDSVSVLAALHLAGAPGDSSLVRLALSDALIPGEVDTAATLVRLVAPASVPPVGPVALAFAPPMPSPSHGPVTLRYTLAEAAQVRMAVYSVQGARVRTLADGVAAAGSHELRWDARDASGRPAPAGVYLVRLSAGRASLTRRVVVAP